MRAGIILASASPRRKEILEKIGLKFHIDYCDIDESLPEGIEPTKAVEYLSRKKAEAVAAKYDQGIIIASDTIVVLDDTILGKPLDEEDAFEMLSGLQGSFHRVISGLAVMDVKSGKLEVSHEVTWVKMCSMSRDMIQRYIETGEVKDKAGSYAIQELGALLVERIEGDYFNVVGLPLFLLGRILKDFGIKIF